MSDADKQPTEQNVDTGGGSYVQGDANVGADLVGRDKIINIYHGTPKPGSPESTPLPDVPCPYRGLEFFDVQHAPNYFGRQEMTAKLLAKVQECNFIAVVGPSGSGKSSLVRAGLMVALQKGAIQGSNNWELSIFRPGENPLLALAAKLVPLLDPSLSTVDRLSENEKLAGKLRNGELSIGYVLDQLRGSMPRLLLIVDQFEETFTLCTDETLRTKFLDTLLTATEKPWLMVIFTLRADFYGRVLEQETFSKRVDAGLVNVLPMTSEERRTAIEQPALQAGRHFESGLAERIVTAVEAEPGQLPLLEFALTELWARQSAEGTLTHAAYEAIGEVSGAIAKRADDTLRSLPKADQERVRTIFTRLVRVAPPDEGSDDTKRRLLLDELDPSLRPLVQSLADARLLVTGMDEQNKSQTAEIAHEALIRKWSVLQTWLNSDREFLLWRQRLHTLVENWQTTNKDAGSLLRGATLNEAQGWLAARTNELSQSEQTFIVESQKQATQEQAEREATRQRQLEQERALTESQRLRAEEEQKRAESERLRAEEQTTAAQNLRRRNQYLRVALALMALAVLIAGYFWNDARNQQQFAQGEVIVRSTAEALAVTREAQANSAAAARATEVVQRTYAQATAIAEKERADQNQAIANAQNKLSKARELVVQAQHQIKSDPELAILLALEAERITNTIEAKQVLTDSLKAFPLSGSLRFFEDRVTTAKFSTNDEYIAIAHESGTIEVRAKDENTNVRESLSQLTASFQSPVKIRDFAFSPDDTMIAVAGEQGSLFIWRWETSDISETFGNITTTIKMVKFSPDSTHIVAVLENNAAILQKVSNLSKHPSTFFHPKSINSVEFSHDNQFILTTCDDGVIRVWNIETGTLEFSLLGHQGAVHNAKYSPDDSVIGSIGEDATVRLWTLAPRIQEKIIYKFEYYVENLLFTDPYWRQTPYDPYILAFGDNGIIKVWLLNLSTRDKILSSSYNTLDATLTMSVNSGDTYLSKVRSIKSESDNPFSSNGLYLYHNRVDHGFAIWTLPFTERNVPDSANFVLEIHPTLTTSNSLNDRINAITFSHNSHYLLTVADHLVQVWMTSFYMPEAGNIDLVSLAESRITRSFTCDERTKFYLEVSDCLASTP